MPTEHLRCSKISGFLDVSNTTFDEFIRGREACFMTNIACKPSLARTFHIVVPTAVEALLRSR